ncbi:flippase [Pedobacter gandavensis]|uniref:Oligosaccharide flippase family protein n=1 Tax=Pedobacter gandavensis TaxID=2679963 RepID=A0ABR6EXJ2_9SPHI|nr:flippase [Pedobacter gandavensis]MBB2149974.1 oligosaccharide flippase family protein [Pedobacter gandavensis]
MKIPSIPGFDQGAIEKYAKNAGWLLIARVGSLAIKIVASICVGNYLGAEEFGIYNYPLVFTTFFIAAAALGLDGFVTRELLRFPEKKNELLGTAFILKLIGGIIVLPLVYIAYHLAMDITTIDAPLSYILVVSFTGIVQAFNIIDSYFQSKAQGKFIMTVQVMGNLLSAGFKLLLIVLGMSLNWFIAALLMDVIALAAGYIYVYQKEGGSIFEWKFKSPLARFLLKNSWPIAFSAILISIYMKIDALMIQGYLGSEQQGIYSSVVQLSEAWYFIPVAIVTAVFPAIMNAKRDDPERYQRRMQNMYDLMVWISMSIALFISFASPIIYRIVYTPEYWPAAHVLTIHIWAGIFTFLGTASGQFLIAEGYTKLSMLRTGAGAVVNIVLNIWWIPKYGISGAAVATLIAYASSNFMILLIPKTRHQGLMMLKSLFLITLVEKIKNRTPAAK